MKSSAFSLIIILILSAFMLSSCKKSTESLIKSYRKAAQELVVAAKEGDSKKVLKKEKKIARILDKLKKRELSRDEENQIKQIYLEYGMALLAIEWATGHKYDFLHDRDPYDSGLEGFDFYDNSATFEWGLKN